jgi:hypothetical protein
MVRFLDSWAYLLGRTLATDTRAISLRGKEAPLGGSGFLADNREDGFRATRNRLNLSTNLECLASWA